MHARLGPDAIDWRVYVILDPRFVPSDKSLLTVAEAALAGGARVLQLRDKQASGRELVEEASALTALCARYDALFIVNDRFDVALAAGAHGVHLGPDDIPAAMVRRVAPSLIIGGSAGEVARAMDLVEEGVDYLGCGAVYDASPSKANASAPRGTQMIRDITSAVSVPVVGIGGITHANAPAVVAAGASGVAVIREIVAADEPETATRRLLAATGSGM